MPPPSNASSCPVVEQQHGRAMLREVLLEVQDLAAVAQRPLRQQAQLRQRVEHDAPRLRALDEGEDGARGLGQLDIRRPEHRVLGVELQLLLERGQLEHREPVERPPVRVRDLADLGLGLRQRDVERALARGDAGEQELQRQRALADARVALDQIDAVARQPSFEDHVEPGDVERSAIGRGHPRTMPRLTLPG
jgi:hypothetical protein